MNINYELLNFQRIKMHRMNKYSRKRFEQVWPVYGEIVIKITISDCRAKIHISPALYRQNVQNYILSP